MVVDIVIAVVVDADFRGDGLDINYLQNYCIADTKRYLDIIRMENLFQYEIRKG
jgi:hypothetical protein